MARATPLALGAPVPPTDAEIQGLALDLGRMIEDARRQVARTANAALTTLYWQLGKHIHENVLAGRRAEYGAQIVVAVGRHLEARHGRGFGENNLRRMIQFVEAFPVPEIVATLRRQLGWAHFGASRKRVIVSTTTAVSNPAEQ